MKKDFPLTSRMFKIGKHFTCPQNLDLRMISAICLFARRTCLNSELLGTKFTSHILVRANIYQNLKKQHSQRQA